MQLLPIVPLREQVMFPGIVMVLDVAGPAWNRLAEELARTNPKTLFMTTQVSGDPEAPSADDLSRLGIVTELVRLSTMPTGGYRLIVRGLARGRIKSVLQVSPFLTAEIEDVEEIAGSGDRFDELVVELRKRAKRFIELSPDAPKEATEIVDAIEDAGQLADRIAAHLGVSIERRLEISVQLDVTRRVKMVVDALGRRIEELRVTEAGDPELREKILRDKMRAIKEELGEEGDDPALDELARKLDEADLPDEPRAVARRELRRLRSMQPASPDYTVSRTYLEWLVELPWSTRSEDKLDLDDARRILDEDHHGLSKIKKRVLEYLAVRKLRPEKKGPILLFAGPPGVGKTSLGRSIARALGRKLARVSLGGVRDEAAIRGHRRTYIGALPGRIIQALRQAGTRNPVFLLDEVDKLGADFRGDPSAALLEVLDPEQNHAFSDHYLEVPFDLSEVIFIATANDLAPIPPPLRDRMELLTIPGYTPAEKRAIAEKHLVPKQLAEHGLEAVDVTFASAALDEVIDSYTREAGVRNLEREIASIVRAVAVKVAAGESFRAEIEAGDVARALGPPRFLSDAAEAITEPGIATGLAVTPAGGEILFVEASRMPGQGKLVLTGQLGDVMRESAQAALSFVRSHADTWELSAEIFTASDFHLHVPAGATPKDGPSAGNAMVTALVSLLTGRRVRGDVAMTGEITLRGLVLPVGGIASKVLAAHRAGAKRVILPDRNAKDAVDIPSEVRDALEIVYVKRIDETLDAALEPPPAVDAIGPDPLAIVPASVPPAEPARLVA